MPAIGGGPDYGARDYGGLRCQFTQFIFVDDCGRFSKLAPQSDCDPVSNPAGALAASDRLQRRVIKPLGQEARPLHGGIPSAPISVIQSSQVRLPGIRIPVRPRNGESG